jgi:hypothetical protein
VTLDTSRVSVPGGVASATLALQASYLPAVQSSVRVVCNLPGNGAFASDTKLTALKVGQVVSEADVTG